MHYQWNYNLPTAVIHVHTYMSYHLLAEIMIFVLAHFQEESQHIIWVGGYSMIAPCAVVPVDPASLCYIQHMKVTGLHTVMFTYAFTA